MSLINDALKKAQRQRAVQPAAGAGAADPSSAGPTGAPKRAHRAQSFVLVGAGAATLVILSVVLTVYLVNRPAPAPTTSAAPPVKVLSTASNSPAPVIVAPVVSLPSVVEKSPTASASGESPPAAAALVATTPAAAAPIESPPPTEASSPAPAKSTPPPLSEASAAAAPLPARILPVPSHVATPNVRIQIFVDAIRVTGVRSLGSDSKVLMNDRVYRVNDIVDRTLAIRLVKVQADALTFTDSNGVTYTKNF